MSSKEENKKFKKSKEEAEQLKRDNKTLSPQIIDKSLEIQKLTGLPYEDVAICLRDFPKLSKKAIEIAAKRKLCPWDVAHTLKNFPEVAERAIKNAKAEHQEATWLAVEYKRAKTRRR